MQRLVALSVAHGINLVDEMAIAAVDFMRIDANNRACIQVSMPMAVQRESRLCRTVFLVHLLDTFCIAARPHYIVVEFREICCSRQLWSRNMAQGMEIEIPNQIGNLV